MLNAKLENYYSFGFQFCKMIVLDKPLQIYLFANKRQLPHPNPRRRCLRFMTHAMDVCQDTSKVKIKAFKMVTRWPLLFKSWYDKIWLFGTILQLIVRPLKWLQGSLKFSNYQIINISHFFWTILQKKSKRFLFLPWFFWK